MAAKRHTFTIPQSGTESNEVALDGRSLTLWSLPAMTGTSLALQHKNEAGAWTALLDDTETAITLTAAAAARQRRMGAELTHLCGSVRLVSNGTEVAARTIYAYSDSFVE